MIARTGKHSLRVPAALLTGLAVSASVAAAAEFHLVAGETDKLMPDGVTVAMWGFAFDPDFGGDGVVTVPGPRLVVPPGDTTLTVHVKNTLPDPVSIIIPSQMAVLTPVKFTDAQGRDRVRSFTHETAPGATGTYTWSSFRPGTHLYFRHRVRP